MRKESPLNTNVLMSTECWSYYRIAAILSNEKYLPWFIERFIYLELDNDFHCYYYDWENVDFDSVYDEVLRYEKIDFINKKLINEIIEAINKKGYVHIICDYFYIEGCKQYQKEHYLHEILIYGYDLDSKTFIYADADIDMFHFGIHEIGFEQLEKSFFEAYKEYSKCKMSYKKAVAKINWTATIFYLREDYQNEVDIFKFYEAIHQWNLGKKYVIEDCKNIVTTRKAGVSIYKGYYEDLSKELYSSPNLLEDDPDIVYGIKKLIESKEGLVYRMNYLSQKGIIGFNKEILDGIDSLCNQLREAFASIIRYQYTQQTIYIDNACKQFKIAEEIDIEVHKAIAEEMECFIEQEIINNIKLF